MSMLDLLALEHSENQFRDANLSPSARREYDAMQQASREYQEDRGHLEAHLRAIDSNAELSDEGRRRRREEAVRAWDEEADRHLSRLEARAAHLVPNAVRQLTVPPLHVDPTTAEVRRSAAERHTQMMLERVPVGQLQDRMMEYAISTDYPDVAYVLSATAFGRMYLEARGLLGEAATDWETRRLETLRPRLSETGRRALDDLPSLRDIARLPSNLRGLYTVDRARYGLPRK